MKILYLYAELMGYTMATIRELANRGNEVAVVHWDHRKLTPYSSPDFPNVKVYGRSKLTDAEMLRLAESVQPDVTVVSGWMDRGYMSVAKHLRKSGSRVVVGLDGQWTGSIKQCLAMILGWTGYFRSHYSHAWVAGAPQFEFARRLGFSRENVVFDLYAADLNLFNRVYLSSDGEKKKRYPHRFLYVGRYESIKGLDTLLQAWVLLKEDKEDWELHLVGNGSLKEKLEGIPGLVVKDFMQPEYLAKEVESAGCFLLPSNSEPWGVVVHEFAAAGLPIIASDSVGAASTFLISGLNGYSFKVRNPTDLAGRMRKVISMTDSELHDMSTKSHELSQRITPETSASNLLSIVY